MRQTGLAKPILGALALLLISGVCALAQGAGASYVGSDKCSDCHTDAAAAWDGSHHALAWTKPGPDTIVADFDGAEFSHDGMTARFRIEGGEYYATVTEKDGATQDYKVHSVAGIEPLQQYLIETEPGRLQSFDVAWDKVKGRWYHLYPDQDLPPDDGLHWTGSYKNWNARCAECHATGFEKNFDPQTGTYASTEAEIGVGCEACHGPGSDHVDWARLATTQQVPDLPGYGLTVDLGQGGETLIQQCAGCHSRREAIEDGNPVPGTAYHDAYTLSLLRPGLYHGDGQILDEVYVYGSFLQSRMYARGVTCMNCHDPHSARLLAEDNTLCTQCHNPAGNPDFPTLRKSDYDAATHHFHPDGSDGAQCKSCHMIERTYMGIDGRRDHSFRIPRPDLATQTGGPDACTDCHTDQNPAWAAEQISTWYPASTRRGAHYGQTLAGGLQNPTQAAPGLISLARDAEQPAIVRATALWILENAATPEIAADVAPLLSDPDPLVRSAALGAQRAAPAQDSVARIVPLLSDPMRAVRIAAAKSLIGLPIARMPNRIAAAARQAQGEWQASLGNRLDFPETHLVLGGLALTMRNAPAATAAFRRVVQFDPQRIEAWTMLARIAAATEGADAARSVVDEALAINPEDPGLNAMRRELN